MSWCIVRDPVAMKLVEWEPTVPSLAPEQLSRVLTEFDSYVAQRAVVTGGCRLLSSSGMPVAVRVLTEETLPKFCNCSPNGEFAFQLAILPGFRSAELRGETRVISFGSRFALMTGEVNEADVRDALSRITAFYLPDLGVLPLCGSLTKSHTDPATTLFLGRPEYRQKLLKAYEQPVVNSNCGLGWSGVGVFPLDPEQNTVYQHPSNLVYVIADDTGVLPPISMLTDERAISYFQGGCHETEPPGIHLYFGSRSSYRSARSCGAILGRRLEAHRPRCWMLNLGALGGPHGKPIDITMSVALLKAALSGTLAKMSFQFDTNFHLLVPVCCPGVPSAILDQRANWMHPSDYDQAAKNAAALLRRIS